MKLPRHISRVAPDYQTPDPGVLARGAAAPFVAGAKVAKEVDEFEQRMIRVEDAEKINNDQREADEAASEATERWETYGPEVDGRPREEVIREEAAELEQQIREIGSEVVYRDTRSDIQTRAADLATDWRADVETRLRKQRIKDAKVGFNAHMERSLDILAGAKTPEERRFRENMIRDGIEQYRDILSEAEITAANSALKRVTEDAEVSIWEDAYQTEYLANGPVAAADVLSEAMKSDMTERQKDEIKQQADLYGRAMRQEAEYQRAEAKRRQEKLYEDTALAIDQGQYQTYRDVPRETLDRLNQAQREKLMSQFETEVPKVSDPAALDELASLTSTEIADMSYADLLTNYGSRLSASDMTAAKNRMKAAKEFRDTGGAVPNVEGMVEDAYRRANNLTEVKRGGDKRAVNEIVNQVQAEILREQRIVNRSLNDTEIRDIIRKHTLIARTDPGGFWSFLRPTTETELPGLRGTQRDMAYIDAETMRRNAPLAQEELARKIISRDPDAYGRPLEEVIAEYEQQIGQAYIRILDDAPDERVWEALLGE